MITHFRLKKLATLFKLVGRASVAGIDTVYGRTLDGKCEITARAQDVRFVRRAAPLVGSMAQCWSPRVLEIIAAGIAVQQAAE